MRRSFTLIISLLTFLLGSTVVFAESKAERATRIKNDREVLRALAEAGSDLGKPHKIEFHFVSYDEAKASALAKEGKTLGYEVSKIESMVDTNQRKHWFFDLIQNMVPTKKTISVHSEAMVKLAEKHEVEFDGWGCLVVK